MHLPPHRPTHPPTHSKVVGEARPAALAAEEAELDSVHLRQLAADTQYHAEVR